MEETVIGLPIWLLLQTNNTGNIVIYSALDAIKSIKSNTCPVAKQCVCVCVCVCMGGGGGGGHVCIIFPAVYMYTCVLVCM